MFTVELDLHLTFDPPMRESDTGIIVNRTLQLPFAPSEGTSVHGAGWDFFDEPHGYVLILAPIIMLYLMLSMAAWSSRL